MLPCCLTRCRRAYRSALNSADRAGRRLGRAGQSDRHGIPDDAQGLVGELQVRGDDLARGRGREQFRLRRRGVAHAGLERADAQVLGGEEHGAERQGPVLGQAQGLLPLLDRDNGVPVEMPIRSLLEVAQSGQGGLQLDDVLAVAHALFKGSPGGNRAVEQVGVRTAHRVNVVALSQRRAGRGQRGDDAVKGALLHVGVRVAQITLHGRLPHQVAALNRRSRPIERLRRVGSRTRSLAGGHRQRADREECRGSHGTRGSWSVHLAPPACAKHLFRASSGISGRFRPSPGWGSFTS